MQRIPESLQRKLTNLELSLSKTLLLLKEVSLSSVFFLYTCSNPKWRFTNSLLGVGWNVSVIIFDTLSSAFDFSSTTTTPFLFFHPATSNFHLSTPNPCSHFFCARSVKRPSITFLDFPPFPIHLLRLPSPSSLRLSGLSQKTSCIIKLSFLHQIHVF